LATGLAATLGLEGSLAAIACLAAAFAEGGSLAGAAGATLAASAGTGAAGMGKTVAHLGHLIDLPAGSGVLLLRNAAHEGHVTLLTDMALLPGRTGAET
jgi:hypothetical protein